MKKTIKIVLFSILLFGLFVSNIFTKDKVFSSLENRVLMTKPIINTQNIFTDKLRQDIESYTNDQFIFRDKWVSLKTFADITFGKKDNGRIYFGKEGFLFDVDKKLDEEQIIENIEVITSFSENLSKRARVKLLLVPTKSQVYTSYLPKFAPLNNEEENYDVLKHVIDTHIPIYYPIDVLDASDDNLLYYKTDHHWSAYGAYLAYQSFIGKKAFPFDAFNIETVSTNFYGSNYRKANNTLIKPDSIQSMIDVDDYIQEILIDGTKELDSYYDPSFLNKTDQYSYFLGGDYGRVDITTTAQNNKSILIFKDSFANALVPYLTRHYKNITLIDLRYYKQSIGTLNIEDSYREVLFLYNLQSFIQDQNLNKLIP